MKLSQKQNLPKAIKHIMSKINIIYSTMFVIYNK